MATSEQVKDLITSHIDNDNTRFKDIVLGIAAHEREVGHTAYADSISALAKDIITEPGWEMEEASLPEALIPTATSLKLSDVVLPALLEKHIQQIIAGYRNRDVFEKHGLEPERLILLTGESGTGKAMTAKAVAGELGLPLYYASADKMDRAAIGYIAESSGTYIFDAVPSESILERITTRGLIFVISPALPSKSALRQFDEVLHYQLPGRTQIIDLMKKAGLESLCDENVIMEAVGLSHADILKVFRETKRLELMNGTPPDKKTLVEKLRERKEIYKTQGRNE